jgi:hypothetical protein
MSAWPDPWALFVALGAETVKRRAAEGYWEAQFSHGYLLVSEADGGVGTPLGGSGRSPLADVGLAPCTAHFPAAHQTDTRRCDHLTTKCFICGCQP